MDGLVAFTAHVDGNSHLCACVAFLEPTIAMAPPRNQVMFCRAFLHRTVAKLAGLHSIFRHHSPAEEDVN